MDVAVLPSLLASDFARLAEELSRCEAAGARMVHVDVMDGHFVPNITIGPVVVEAMRKATRLHMDVHLMITDPMRYAADFRAAGADAITVHVEAVGQRHLVEALQGIRKLGAKAGVAFNPDTDPELWYAQLEEADLAMLMTVYPGFGGQAFIPQVRPRIRALRARFPVLPIQVDGGINRQTIPGVLADGANRLVMGHAFFHDREPAALLSWAEGGARG